MADQRFDSRLSSLTAAVRDLAHPQPVYRDKAEHVRAERVDGVVNLYRHEDITRINRHPGVLGNGGRGGSFATDKPLIPLEIDGPDHAKWRRLLDPFFAPKQVRLLEDSVRALARELVAGFAADGQVELYERFCVPLPCLTFLRLVGAPVQDLDFFLEFKDGVIHPQGDTVEEIQATMASAGARIYEYFASFLPRRRAETEPQPDVISALLRAELDGAPISDDDLLNILFLLMFAGLDTVTSSLSCMFAWLAQHPDERRRIVADPTLVAGTVEELLRHESPVPGGTRYSTVDIDLGDGLVIQAGETIHAVWAAANLDPAAFADPLRVDIDRARHTHIAFASGTHRCLGSHLARMELRLAIEEFHRLIPDYQVPPGEQPKFDNMAVRAAHHLPLQWR